jgi:hypothetical protein
VAAFIIASFREATSLPAAKVSIVEAHDARFEDDHFRQSRVRAGRQSSESNYRALCRHAKSTVYQTSSRRDLLAIAMIPLDPSRRHGFDSALLSSRRYRDIGDPFPSPLPGKGS